MENILMKMLLASCIVSFGGQAFAADNSDKSKEKESTCCDHSHKAGATVSSSSSLGSAASGVNAQASAVAAAPAPVNQALKPYREFLQKKRADLDAAKKNVLGKLQIDPTDEVYNVKGEQIIAQEEELSAQEQGLIVEETLQQELRIEWGRFRADHDALSRLDPDIIANFAQSVAESKRLVAKEEELIARQIDEKARVAELLKAVAPLVNLPKIKTAIKYVVDAGLVVAGAVCVLKFAGNPKIYPDYRHFFKKILFGATGAAVGFGVAKMTTDKVIEKYL